MSVTFLGGGGKMREIDVRVNFALLVLGLVLLEVEIDFLWRAYSGRVKKKKIFVVFGISI